MTSNNVFDLDLIKKRMAVLKDLPPFEPDKFEPQFSVSLLYPDGTRCELWWVYRNSDAVYFKSITTYNNTI